MIVYCDECGAAMDADSAYYYIRDGDAVLCREHMSQESVALIASGYDWFCPKCDAENHEDEESQEVVCTTCRTWFSVDKHVHAWRQND